MKLEIPGQLRGSDAGKVMPVAIELRRELEPSFAALGDEELTLISPLLRIGGELGTFGADGIENIRITDKEAECEVVIDARNWKAMNEEQISTLIRPRIIEALSRLLVEAGLDTIPGFLREETDRADPAGVQQPPTGTEST